MGVWSVADVAERLGARVVGDAAARFVAATTDSRDSREGTAFFALDGAKHRGSEFVPDAFGSGCSVVVVPEDWSGDVPEGRAAILVPDPEEALLRLAARARDAWTGPVLAVTGSVGKTTVKEMTAHALHGKGRVLSSPGNFNTAVGLSRTLLCAEEAPDVAVLEAGASQPGEIARLAALVRPTAAAVTNVSAAHLEGFGTIDDVRREKLDLLRAVPADGRRVVDGDDARLVAAAGAIGPVMRVGFGAGNDLRAIDVRRDGAGTAFRVEGGGEGRLAAPGAHQVKNALIAVALAETAGVARDEALARLATFAPVAGRLSVRVANGVTILDDTYNANPTSMNAAIDWLAGLAATRRAVVLGDMLELGPQSRELHEALGRRVAELDPELAVFAGRESRAASEECSTALGDRCRWTKSPEEAARLLRAWVRPGDAVLVKGSRGMRMEQVVDALTGTGGADAG